MSDVKMSEIKIDIKGGRPFAGRITGTGGQYGHALQFLPLCRKSATYHTATITAPGQYKVPKGAVVGARRIDTGFFRVEANGAVTEISRQDVVL